MKRTGDGGKSLDDLILEKNEEKKIPWVLGRRKTMTLNIDTVVRQIMWFLVGTIFLLRLDKLFF